MATILEMPKLSPTMEEGRLAIWHKKEGDTIAIDDLLAEVETDKATMEFRSFDKGVLLKILSNAGSMVVLGQPVAIVGQQGEDISQLMAQVQGKTQNTHSTIKDTTSSQQVPQAIEINPQHTQEIDSETKRIKASPLVRRLAREQGYDLRTLHGSGPHGRIIQRDLVHASSITKESRITLPDAEVREPPEVQPLSMMRKTIARRLTESKQTVPHFYLSVDLNVTALVALREQINQDLASELAADKSSKISINDLLIRACALALKKVPRCNAQFSQDAILIYKNIDISVAVAVEEGLVTPVVRNADRKSVLELSNEVRELAMRARQKKLKPEEMTGGTFSISNLGMYGIDSFAAVINPPEGAIIAIGQVRKEPIIDNDSIAIGHRLACTMSCDHRVIDGAIGALFLKELRVLIEHPTRLLIG